MNVVRNKFPEAEISGCLFHLAQSFWRRLQSEGLAGEYRQEENEDFRAYFHSLISLAFLPKEDIFEAFDQLQELMPDELTPIADYLEDNYLRGRRRGRGRQRPQFPPETWNCYERTLENLPRTTNTCEAWHRRINTLIGKHHPSFFHAIEQFQAEVSEINRDIERLEAGHSPQRKRRKYIATDSRILRIVENYQTYKANDNILGYLRAIGHNVAGTL